MIAVGDPGDMMVCHRCDVRSCCNPKHLFLGSALDNARDMVSKLRVSHGERHPFAVLSLPEVKEIRSLRAEGRSYRSLAREFSVSCGCVGHIVHGDNWSLALATASGDGR